MTFDTDCRACLRLATFLDEVRTRHPDYHARPVPAFGDPAPELLIVGLAPGMHGANRSGRPFTGDYAGVLLYETLHRFGYASAPVSVAVDDDLTLTGCRITNAVKCLPPANKPEPSEIRECNRYLAAELAALPEHASILALGQIAHQAVLRALGLTLKDYPFLNDPGSDTLVSPPNRADLQNTSFPRCWCSADPRGWAGTRACRSPDHSGRGSP